MITEKDIIRCREFVYPDSYAYVVRNKKTNKLLISEWFVDKAEEELEKILKKKII